MLRLQGGIPGAFPMLHAEEDTKGTGSRLACSAITGEREEGGSRPYHVELTVRLFINGKDAGKSEDYFRAIEDTFRRSDLVPAAQLAAFRMLQGLPAGDDEKEARTDGRQRARVFHFLALEA